MRKLSAQGPTLLALNDAEGSKVKGFASLILVILIVGALVLLGGIYLFGRSSTITPSALPILTTPTPAFKIYTDNLSGFKFDYPSNLVAKQDSEDDYSKRNNGDARKNFTGYVQYSPAKFLAAVSVLGSDSAFDNSPFSVWVFDNPTDLSVEAFFNKYWYYPFLWGQFNPPEKQPLAPKNEASISGQSAWYGVVSYQSGSPKYYYLKTKDQKMLLIRVLSLDQTGDQILKTLKLN